MALAGPSATQELDDWGYRAGAGPDECKISGVFISKADGVKTGLWECTPGSFPAEKRANTESVYIISGRVRITDLDESDGDGRECGPGDSFVLEKGSSVRWTVLETCRKFFVIAE